MQPPVTEQNSRIRIYEPNHIKNTGIRAWSDMVNELIEYRGLIWRLVIRDISARYRQSVLGILWSFLTPLFMMVIFVVVKNNRILPIGETMMPYAAYVFFGQMMWLLFSQGLTGASNSLISSSSLLAKINFPKEVLILSSLGQTIFDFIIRIPLLIIIFFWVGFVPKPAIILVPVIIIPLLFLIFGLGLLVAMFNAIIRDIGSVLLIVLSVAMFASPVIYPPPTAWPLAFWINHVNPVSGFLIAAQDLAAKGYIADPAGYFSAVLFSIVILLVGWRIFHLVEPKIAERI
jgi:lipopolysaccharide transport system permease protein